jgi:hypothetical protein
VPQTQMCAPEGQPLLHPKLAVALPAEGCGHIQVTHMLMQGFYSWAAEDQSLT